MSSPKPLPDAGASQRRISRSESRAPTVTLGDTEYECPYADLLTPLTAEEFAALKADIRRRGIVYPVVVSDRTFHLLDGYHRVRVAHELGLPVDAIPVEHLYEVEPDRERELAEAINFRRRHLTLDQRRECAARLLRDDPARSDRSIAQTVDLDNKTVAAVRRELEAAGTIVKAASRRGADGARRSLPAAPPNVVSPTPCTAAPAGEPVEDVPVGDLDGAAGDEPAHAPVAPQEITPLLTPVPAVRPGLAPQTEAPADISPPHSWSQLREMADTLQRLAANLRKYQETRVGRQGLGTVRKVHRSLGELHTALGEFLARPPASGRRAEKRR